MRKLRDNKSLGNAELQLIIQTFDTGSARRLPLSVLYFLSKRRMGKSQIQKWSINIH